MQYSSVPYIRRTDSRNADLILVNSFQLHMKNLMITIEKRQEDPDNENAIGQTQDTTV